MANDLSGREFKSIVLRQLSRIGKALSDPVRLGLLELLCQSEKSVDNAARQMGVSMANASHHLQVLKGSGLARERRSGRFVYYQATEAGKDAWRGLTGIAEAGIAEVRDALSGFFEADLSFEPTGLRVLREKVRRGTSVLLDVRPADEFRAGHFPGAISVPLAELAGSLKMFPRGAQVVAYCRGPYCVLAHDAVLTMRRHGIPAYYWRQGVLDWTASRVRNAKTRNAGARRPAKGVTR